MNSVVDREEILKRLNKSCHPDNQASIYFIDSVTKSKLKDVRVEILEGEQTDPKVYKITNIDNSPAFLNNSNKEQLVSLNLNITGDVRFEIDKKRKYRVTVNSPGYEEKEIGLDGLELLQNNQIGFLLKKLDCKQIKGLLTLKKMQLDLQSIQLKLICSTVNKSSAIAVNDLGQFNITCETNKEYRLEIYTKNELQKLMDLPILQKNQSVGDLQISTDDFDIIIQDDNQNKVIYNTAVLSKPVTENMDLNPNEVIRHFLNGRVGNIEKGMIFQLSNYNYDYIGLQFTDQCKQELDYLSRLLMQYPKMKISVSVHTDDVGSSAFNQQFSYDIALKIARYLSSKGADKNKILARGMGSNFPLSEIRTKTNNGDIIPNPNRRVEVEILSL